MLSGQVLDFCLTEQFVLANRRYLKQFVRATAIVLCWVIIDLVLDYGRLYLAIIITTRTGLVRTRVPRVLLFYYFLFNWFER